MQDSSPSELTATTYAELRKLAVHAMRSEQRRITLSPTVLLHEALLRVWSDALTDSAVKQAKPLLFTVMRHVLTDHARRRISAAKATREMPAPDESLPGPAETYPVQAAIRKLFALDARLATVVELRILAGFSNEEIAERLGCSLRTVIRDWKTAQLWLRRELESRK